MPIIIPGNRLASTGHTISQSIRFNDGDSPYLQKTYSGAGSRTTFTFSVWAKLGDYNVSSGFPFFNGGTGTSDTTWGGFSFYQGKIYVQGYNTNYRISTRLLRDPSAWYHIVYVWDTTNAIADERVRVYVNGVRLTDFSTYNNPGASANSGMNQAAVHTIGYQSRTVGYGYADAYMAEMVFLDGTATDCNSFGEFNSSGIWIPKDVSELTFGTNGFHIDGRDASDLGDDESGQGNDYTASGLASHDQVADSPTNSFCVLNPIMNMTYQYLTPDVRDVNLASQSVSASLNNYAIGSMGVTSGKWYFEARYPTYPALSGVRVGFISLENASSNIGGNSYGKEKVVLLSNRHTTSAFSNFEWGNGSSYPNTSATSQTPFVQDDIIGVAFDCDNSTIQFYKNGSTFGSQFDYSAQSNAVDTSDGDTYAPIVMGDNTTYTNKVVLNFGQDSTFNGGTTAGGNSDGSGIGNFKYSVPSGYKALCTKNLGS